MISHSILDMQLKLKGWWLKGQSIFVVFKTTLNKTEVIRGVGRPHFTLWLNSDHTKPATSSGVWEACSEINCVLGRYLNENQKQGRQKCFIVVHLELSKLILFDVCLQKQNHE